MSITNASDMPQDWWAWSDDKLVPLGVCDGFDEADEKAPERTHWLFNRATLEDMVDKAARELQAGGHSNIASDSRFVGLRVSTDIKSHKNQVVHTAGIDLVATNGQGYWGHQIQVHGFDKSESISLANHIAGTLRDAPLLRETHGRAVAALKALVDALEQDDDDDYMMSAEGQPLVEEAIAIVDAAEKSQAVKGLLPFTVLLLRPEHITDNYGPDTFTIHVYAATPAAAVKIAQENAAKSDANDSAEPEDYRPLLTTPGHIHDVTPTEEVIDRETLSDRQR